MVDDTDEAADMRIARHIIGVHCHGFHAFDTVPYKTDAIQRCVRLDAIGGSWPRHYGYTCSYDCLRRLCPLPCNLQL